MSPFLQFNVHNESVTSNKAIGNTIKMGKRALIWGASGVTGWSFVNEMLHDYPRQGIWDGVVAMTNRPLKQEDSLWPKDARLQIVSGVSLLDSQEVIEQALKEKVENIDRITHVYYLGENRWSTGL